MRTIINGASNNGARPQSWSQSWTHLGVDRRSLGYCRVTFNHPPINTITATTVAELAELVGLIEQDSDLNVVVFDSANPDFYLAHYDNQNDPGKTAMLGLGPSGLSVWNDLLVRLARAPLVSIASIRGRARGAGSEFVLANDLRFASRELVADDLDGPRAERYGYINRAVADDRLDDEVEAIATRLSRFDHEAIARVKSYVDLTTLPSTSNGLSGNTWSTPCPTRTPERTVRTAAGSRGIGHHAFRVPRGLAVIIVLTPRAVPALRWPGLSGRGRRGRWRQGEPWCDARGKARVYHGRDRVPPRVTMADVDELWRQP